MNDGILKVHKKIAENIALPSEVVLQVPKITIIGMNEITIENHKGIKKFKKNMVEVNSEVGSIKVIGNDFEIVYIGSYTIIISGVFEAIEYGAKNK